MMMIIHSVADKWSPILSRWNA